MYKSYKGKKKGVDGIWYVGESGVGPDGTPCYKTQFVPGDDEFKGFDEGSEILVEKLTPEQVKEMIVAAVEVHQAFLGVDLKRNLEEILLGKIDFAIPPLFDELVKERRLEKAEFLVPAPPDGWQHKALYLPKDSQFWNATTKFVTPQ